MNFQNFRIFAVFLVMVTYSKAQETSVEIKNHCICHFNNYEPVCGSDGKTYGNTCAFNCEKGPDVVLVRKGECGKAIPKQAKPCICPFIYNPVCGSDGKTYPNSCVIKCQQNKDVVIVSEGECLTDNELKSAPTKVPKASIPCNCTKQFDPVCGSNGKTYANRCMLFCARRSGVEVRIAKRGSCEE